MKLYLKTSALAAMMAAATTILTPVLASDPAVAQPATMTAPTAAALSEATITSLQEALNKQGIAVKVDGILTDETRAAIRKYQSQHHLPVTGEPDKATLDKLGVSVASGAAPAGQAAQAPTTPGMGPMMGPQMMQGMPQGMMGPGMMGQGMMGPGMMGGQMPMAGSMPMQRGMMMCPMMGMMMSGQAAKGTPSMMGGQGTLFGTPLGKPEEMTEDRVRALLGEQLTNLGNPRLKLGEIGTGADGSITAEILTVDGSLVQKLAFNRYPGLVRQIVE